MPGTSAPLPDYGDWTVLFEIAFPRAFDPTGAVEEVVAEALEDGVIADAVFARGERDRQAFWRLREAVPDAQRAAGPAISNDISVVPTRVAELIRNAYAAIERTLPGARPYAFGHVGDGNIHLTVRPPEGRDDALLTVRHEIERAILDEVGRLGGSISAEHGLGLAKNEAIARYKSGAEIALMRKLKNVLDPGNILNPGKVLPAVGTS
jgi:D-lactate dehydrogenase (cytochrome)